MLGRAGRWCAPEFSWPRKASAPVHRYPCILTLSREPLAFRKTRNHPHGPASWRSPVPGSHRVFLPRAQSLPSSWAQFLFVSLVISPSRFRVPLWASGRTLNESALIKFQPSKGVGMGRLEGKFVRLTAGATHTTRGKGGGKQVCFDQLVAPWERWLHPGRNEVQFSLTHLVGSKRKEEECFHPRLFCHFLPGVSPPHQPQISTSSLWDVFVQGM